MRRSAAGKVSVLAVTATVLSMGAAAPPAAVAKPPLKEPVATGYGGAVASVDADASAAGIEVLREGSNAVDAAVAVAAALGVTEPYSAGIGGGGYFAYYDAKSRSVHTIDGRETAPRSADAHLFVENGAPIPFEEGMTSGRGVGTPAPRRPGSPPSTPGAASGSPPCSGPPSGSPARASPSTRPSAPRRPPTRPASATSRPPRGSSCPADDCPRSAPASRTPTSPVRTRSSAARASARSTRAARPGHRRYRPQAPVRPGATRNVRSGDLTERDLASYRTVFRAPTKVSYRGLDVYGMAPPPPAAPASARRSTSWRAPTSPGPRRPATCTGSSRPAASPSPTGAAGSGTRPSSPCRRAACSPGGSRTPAPA